jgi:Transglycosylase-like domain
VVANVDAILATLRAKESTNNYASKPPPGSTASGAYGFLDSTWANYGGYAHAWQAPPAVQDERARKDVEGLLARFNGDATSVFKAWYAGAGFASKDQNAKPVTGGRTYPSINEYAADAMRRMGQPVSTSSVGSVQTVTAQAATQPTPIPGIDPKLPIEDQITALAYSQHGDVLAPFINDPEIRAILKRYVNREIDEDTMVGLVMQTQVYRTTDLSHRKWQDLKASDPATAAKTLEQSKFQIQRTAETLGYQMKPEDVAYLAERVIYDGLSTDQVRSLIVGHFAVTGGGDAGAAYATVNNALGNWMVKVDDATKQQWVTDLLMGRLDESALEAHLRNVNATQFPGMATALQQNPNLTPQAYVAPIRNSIATTLEINPQDIDFTSSKWSQLINYYDPTAKQYRALTTPEIEQRLKTDKTYGWDYTKNSMEARMGFVLNLAQVMGRRPSLT